MRGPERTNEGKKRINKSPTPQHHSGGNGGKEIIKLGKDMVNNPVHYTSGNIEVIDYIQDNLTDEMFEGFCIGNVLKYVSRYRLKNGIEDLAKAEWY